MKIRKLITGYGIYSILLIILGSLQGCDDPGSSSSNSTAKPEFPMTQIYRIDMYNSSDQEIHMYVNGTNGDVNEKIGPGNKLRQYEERTFNFVTIYPDETFQSPVKICVGQNGVTILFKKITIPYDGKYRWLARYTPEGTLVVKEYSY